MSASPLLLAHSLASGYGRVQILWEVGFGVGAGRSVILLGPNGAGKTTLLKTLLGLLPLWQGRLLWAGEDITHWPTPARVRAGMAFMSEIGVFPSLTIRENLAIGAQFLEPKARRERLAELEAAFPDLASRPHALAASLSGGQRKMLGLAKVLAGRPRLVVLDEPSAGLSPLLVGQVIALLRRFRNEGAAFLIAEQNVAFLELADDVAVLEGGRLRFFGPPAQFGEEEALRRAYFGLT
jgi:branched-chain amino acid transport system ATP-binding protein